MPGVVLTMTYNKEYTQIPCSHGIYISERENLKTTTAKELMSLSICKNKTRNKGELVGSLLNVVFEERSNNVMQKSKCKLLCNGLLHGDAIENKIKLKLKHVMNKYMQVLGEKDSRDSKNNGHIT